MKSEKIANRQFSFILFIMRATIPLATLPILTASNARQDAWASALLIFVGTALTIFLIVGLGARFPGKDVVEMSWHLLGKIPGNIISLVILWSFLHMASLQVRIYAEMIIVGFLPETPIIFLTASMILVAMTAAFSGVEVIGRMSDLIFFFLLVMIVFSLGTLFFEADFMNLQPVLSRGFEPVLVGSVVPLGMGSLLLVAAMLIPHLNNPERAVNSALWAMGGAVLVIISTVLLVVATLGPEEGARVVFPFVKAIGGIRISEFLERVEILAVFSWGLGLFVGLSTFVYCGAKGAARVFGLEDYRHILLPMGVIWVVLSIHDFENVFEIRSLLAPEVMGPYGFFLIFFPYLFLWGGYLIRRIEGADHQEKEEKR